MNDVNKRLPRNLAIVKVPVAFTEEDYKRPDWPRMRKSLANLARALVLDEIDEVIREKGWTREE